MRAFLAVYRSVRHLLLDRLFIIFCDAKRHDYAWQEEREKVWNRIVRHYDGVCIHCPLFSRLVVASFVPMCDVYLNLKVPRQTDSIPGEGESMRAKDI